MLSLSAPIRANIEITEACPLACTHCYTYWGYAATGKRLFRDDPEYPPEHFMRVLNILIEAGIRVVTFTGGEPFLRRDVLYPLVKRARVAGLEVFVNTSGCLIREDDAAWFSRNPIDGFLVSLISADEGVNNSITHTSSQLATERGIRLLAKAGQNVSVNMVCSRGNWRTVRETAHTAYRLGARSFSATPMLAASQSEGNLNIKLNAEQVASVLDDLLWAQSAISLATRVLAPIPYCVFDHAQLKRFRGLLDGPYCCAGVSDCAISVHGELRPCLMSWQVAGSLLEEPWSDCWRRLASWRTPDILPVACLTCSVVGECGGGCRVSALRTTGILDGPDGGVIHPLVADYFEDPGHEKEVKKPVEPSLDCAIELVGGLFIRDEVFGASLFGKGKALFLTDQAVRVVAEMRSGRPLTVLELSEKTGIGSEHVQELCGVLLKEHLATRREVQDGKI